MQHSELENDGQLVVRLQSGDKMALALLVKRWHKKFCEKAYWMVKDSDAAKDIAQDSWTIILSKITDLKEPKHFKFWAYRIVCNKATDWLRIQAKKRKLEIDYTVEAKSEDKRYSEEDHQKILLLEAIKLLPNKQQVVLRLYYIESYSIKQISSLLDISVGTAKSRLFHAREKLKKTIKFKSYEN